MPSTRHAGTQSGRGFTPEELSRMDQSSFVATLGEIFEHSPWVAEGAWRFRPFTGADDLHSRMVEVVRQAGHEAQSGLINAHPDLAGKAALAGEIADASKREQAGSGLNQLTADEFARFQELNAAYRKKFGFPFIVAVRGSNKKAILDGFVERLGNAPDEEFDRALSEIEKIAHFRLQELVRD